MIYKTKERKRKRKRREKKSVGARELLNIGRAAFETKWLSAAPHLLDYVKLIALSLGTKSEALSIHQ
jgi:hypothetical protein